MFRKRAWVRQFFRENGVRAGDWVLLEQMEPYTYRVSRLRELMCLSIQQPWADLILEGKKKVENRSWAWWKERNWKAEGSIALAIHASKSLGVWKNYSEKKREELVPGWQPGDSEIGAVLGVVELVGICRRNELPPRLKDHKFVDEKTDWCWMLAKPRRFSPSYPQTGQVFFNWRIPENIANATHLGSAGEEK
jgi:hypothetical protein